MKFIRFFLFALLANASLIAQGTPSPTDESNQLLYSAFTMDDSDIVIFVDHPNNFLEKEVSNIDLFLQDQKDETKKLAFHVFLDPKFNLSSFSDVTSYTNWVFKQIFPSSDKTAENLFFKEAYAFRSFNTVDEAGRDVYYSTYVGTVENEIVFSAVAMSSKSFDEAADSLFDFLKGIAWGNKSSQ